MAAVKALTKLRAPAAVDSPIETLSFLPDERVGLEIKAEVAAALAAIGDQRAIVPLMDLGRRISEGYGRRFKNPPWLPTSVAPKEFEGDRLGLIDCGFAVLKALTKLRMRGIKAISEDEYEVTFDNADGTVEPVICRVARLRGEACVIGMESSNLVRWDRPVEIDTREIAAAVAAFHDGRQRKSGF